MSMPHYDVLVVGGAGVDTVVRVDALRIPPGDSLHVPPVHDYVAHTGNGVALGWHALGLTTKFIDFLGDDPQGHAVLAAYARRGLDFSHVVSPHGTPRGVNLVDAQGRRFSFYDSRRTSACPATSTCRTWSGHAMSTSPSSGTTATSTRTFTDWA